MQTFAIGSQGITALLNELEHLSSSEVPLANLQSMFDDTLAADVTPTV